MNRSVGATPYFRVFEKPMEKLQQNVSTCYLPRIWHTRRGSRRHRYASATCTPFPDHPSGPVQTDFLPVYRDSVKTRKRWCVCVCVTASHAPHTHISLTLQHQTKPQSPPPPTHHAAHLGEQCQQARDGLLGGVGIQLHGCSEGQPGGVAYAGLGVGEKSNQGLNTSMTKKLWSITLT